MSRGDVSRVIEQLLEADAVLSTRDVAARAGVSRQAAHKQLRALVDAGVLAVEGKARAARYQRGDATVRALRSKVDTLAAALQGIAPAPRRVVDVSRPVDVSAPAPTPAQRAPRRVTLAVAEAGSLYRLSARLLLADVSALVVVLDFNGVMDASDEFLEEVFERWAPDHPETQLEVVHVPEGLRERLARYAG